LERRLGAPEENILTTQSNLASTYHMLGRYDDALRAQQDVYSGRLKLHGEEHVNTLVSANNYVRTLLGLNRYKEAKSLLRKTIPVARRVLGENHDVPLRMRQSYAEALYKDDCATLNDVREAVASLEEIERTARRVLGGANPITSMMEESLREVREALRARETPPPRSA